ncbi:MAG: DNA polymerase Y family protein [Armatimonadetes bacterium]|nr:DNA polymerase Y family protein [Armatimonadota bacterium]
MIIANRCLIFETRHAALERIGSGFPAPIRFGRAGGSRKPWGNKRVTTAAEETWVACVWFPEFPLQVEQQRRPEWAGAPLALLAGERQPVVFACSFEARALGVRRGMPLREVLSLAPQILCEPADPLTYQSVFDRIVLRLEEITPLIEVATPGRAFLGLEGLAPLEGEGTETAPRLYPSAIALAVALEATVTAPFSGFFGLGRGKFTAHVASRFAALAWQRPARKWPNPGPAGWFSPGGRVCRIHAPGPPQAVAAVLRPLPVSWLPVEERMRRKLEQFGLRSLGQLAALPVSAVTAQFGKEGRRAWLLSQGRDEEPLQPRLPGVEIGETLEFPTPEILQEPLLQAVAQLLETALRRPERRGRSVSQVRLEAHLEDSPLWLRTITLRRPAARTEPLFGALRYSLERLPPPAPVLTLTLFLANLTPAWTGQLSLFPEPGEEIRTRLLEELRQLRVRMGRMPVARIVEMDPCSRIPERRYSLIDCEP